MTEKTAVTADEFARCGDHVFHRPTGETWTVAYVDGTHLAWCGWPPGEASIFDCEVTYRCTDEENRKLLEQCAKIDSYDKRASMAKALLSRLGATNGS